MFDMRQRTVSVAYALVTIIAVSAALSACSNPRGGGDFPEPSQQRRGSF